MHLGLTGDIDTTSGVGPVIYAMAGPTRKHFIAQDYGADLAGIAIVLMCQSSSLNLKQRVKFVKNDRRLFVDVMLNLDEMCRLSPEDRKQAIGVRIVASLREVLRKYAFAQFDAERFLNDFTQWWSKG